MQRVNNGRVLERESEIASSVKEDFLARQAERRPYELQWLLNKNFIAGNQYCITSYTGEMLEQEKAYYWQEKQVFNHIAPIVETRLARLATIRPKMSVRPSGESQEEQKASKMASRILDAVCDKHNLSAIIEQAEAWSETCGTAFYKVTWDSDAGDAVKHKDKECKVGDVSISVCSPFEIYPDNNCANELSDCASLMHAKAYPVKEIERIWGKQVQAEDIEVYGTQQSNVGGLGYTSCIPAINVQKKQNCCLVIEKYTAPCAEYPLGQLLTVAGDKVLYMGDLPYANDRDGKRTYPFIRQISHRSVGCFWGVSIVERLIPLQRSYNAVKNRKHEFLNRLSMGVLTVEDGSVDTDNLEEEGLFPGKILVYRSGSDRPSLMESGRVPSDFSYEEDRLLNEFIMISGVSELARNSGTPSKVTSGVALQLLVEQDEARLSATAKDIKNAVKQIGQHIIRLYRQFGATLRRILIRSASSVEAHYFYGNQMSDDVVFETENEISDSPANRRNIVMELLASGILLDENGKMSNSARLKVLDMLGFGNWEQARDLEKLHVKRAERENIGIEKLQVSEIDEHALHIDCHVSYLIDEDTVDKTRHEDILSHIKEHKRAMLEADTYMSPTYAETSSNGIKEGE